MSYMAGGKQHFESTGTRNKKQAEKIFALRQAEIFAGKWDLPAPSPKLIEWTEKFLQSVQVASTKLRYSTSVQHICQHWGKNARLSAISVRSIEEFKAKRLRDVRPASVNRDLAVLRRLLKLAARQRLIGRNPFDGVEMLNERSQRRAATILSFGDQEKILEHATPHLRLMIVLLTEIGLRVGKEALQLKWTDIDFENNALTVRASKSIAGRRVVPLSTLCRTELLHWRDLIGKSSPFIFPNMSNPSKPLGSIKKTWATALKNAGLNPFPIYCLRATFASRLSAAGVPDSFVSQMLGHSGGLLQTYSKAVDEYRRDAIRKLEELRKANIGYNKAAVFVSNSQPIAPSGAAHSTPSRNSTATGRSAKGMES
jgi:integrase